MSSRTPSLLPDLGPTRGPLNRRTRASEWKHLQRHGAPIAELPWWLILVLYLVCISSILRTSSIRSLEIPRQCNTSCSFLFLKLPPPPCAVLLVITMVGFHSGCRTAANGAMLTCHISALVMQLDTAVGWLWHTASGSRTGHAVSTAPGQAFLCFLPNRKRSKEGLDSSPLWVGLFDFWILEQHLQIQQSPQGLRVESHAAGKKLEEHSCSRKTIIE